MHAGVCTVHAAHPWTLRSLAGCVGRIVGAQKVLIESKAVAKHRETGALLPGLEMPSAALVVGFGRQRAARVTAEGQARMQDPGKRSGLQMQVWGSPSHETELLPRQVGVWRAWD